jgi:hypothetical protein
MRRAFRLRPPVRFADPAMTARAGETVAAADETFRPIAANNRP